MAAQAQRRGVAAGVPDRAGVQRQRVRRNAEPVRVTVRGYDRVREVQEPAAAPGSVGRRPRPGADRQRQMRRAAHRHRFVESDLDPNRLAHAERLPALRAGIYGHAGDRRRPIDAAVHSVGGRGGGGPVEDGLPAQAQRCRVVPCAPDRPAVQRQRAGREGDPVRIGVRGLHRVGEHQGPIPGAAGVARLAGERADCQGQPRRAAHPHGFVERDFHPDGLARAVGVAALRAGGQVHPGRARRPAEAAVHLEGRIIGDGLAAQAQGRGVAARVQNGAAVQRQGVGRDADPVYVGVRCPHLIAEKQRSGAAGEIVCPAGIRPDLQCQLWRAGDRYPFTEKDRDLDDFIPPVGRSILRQILNHYANDSRRLVDTAVHLVVRIVRHGMAPQIQCCGVAGSVPEGTGNSRQRIGGDAYAIRVQVRCSYQVAKAETPGTQANRGCLSKVRADHQCQTPRPGGDDVLIETDPYLDEFSYSESVSALRISDGHPAHRRPDVVRAAGHLVTCGVRDGMAAQTQRCGVAARILDRATVQRQRPGPDADPIRIGIRRLDRVVEEQRRASGARAIGRLPGERADRHCQLRRPRHRHGFVERDFHPDGLAHAVGVAALGARKDFHIRHDRGAVDTPVHLVACGVRDGMAAQTQHGGVAPRILNRAAIQRQRPGPDADPIRIGIRRLDRVVEEQRRASGARAIGRLPGERADRHCQLRRPRHRHGFVERDFHPDGLAHAVGVAALGARKDFHIRHDRGAVDTPVHLVACGVRDGMAAQTQRGGVTARILNRAAVQRQRPGPDADPVRVGVPGLCGIDELHPPPA